MGKITVNSPLDLIGVYLTPNMGVGQKLRLETVRAWLSELPLKQTLDLLAQISYRADLSNTKEESKVLAQALLSPSHASNAVKALGNEDGPRYGVVASQVVVGLAINALVHCAEEDGEFEDEWIVPRLGLLLLGLAGCMDDQSSEDFRRGNVQQDIMLEMVREELWYRIHDYDRWFELAHRLIFEVIPELQTKNGAVDPRPIIEKATGLSLENYAAITTAMALYTSGNPKGYIFPHYTDTDVLDNGLVDLWNDFWKIDLDRARELAKEDIKNERMWSFDAFYDRPLLQVDENKMIVIRPWFLALKATPTGYFNTVEMILREGGNSTNPWSNFFGRAIEALGWKLLDENDPRMNRMDEDEIKRKWGDSGKTCDAVLTSKEYWIALDFVHHRITKKTATTGTIDDLAKDLQATVVKKIRQIDETIQRGLAKNKPPKQGIIPLVVVGAPFAVNPLILNELDRMIDKDQMKVVGKNSVCKQPLVMDIQEFWALLETADSEKITSAELIDRWLRSPLANVSFRNWLTTHGPKRAKLKDKRGYQKHVERYLFGREDKRPRDD